MAEIAIRTLEAEPEVIAALARILVEVTANGSSVGFMHPLDPERAASYWRDALADAQRGGRIVFGAFADGALAGTVTLHVATPENQPHRAEIMKLQVALGHRRSGVGARLMAAAEARAAELGRTLLVLDTASDDARRLYERRGWTRVGDIPDYALWPNGEPCATTIYWKSLRPSPLSATASRSA